MHQTFQKQQLPSVFCTNLFSRLPCIRSPLVQIHQIIDGLGSQVGYLVSRLLQLRWRCVSVLAELLCDLCSLLKMSLRGQSDLSVFPVFVSWLLQVIVNGVRVQLNHGPVLQSSNHFFIITFHIFSLFLFYGAGFYHKLDGRRGFRVHCVQHP